MPIGNGATVSITGLNSDLGNAAEAWRASSEIATKLWEFIRSLGANQPAQIAALEAAPISMTPADATNYWTAANESFALSQIYTGAITQPAAFNYDSALAAARGPS